MKRGWKIVAWTLAGLVTVLLSILTLGFWGMSRVGYAFPDKDLPSHLEGRWDWSTAAQPCGDGSHIISFSDDRKTMVLTKPPSGADTGWTATYDIVLVNPSRIRGAIRGETRRTSSGKPVVWDLVMFGPNEYHWQRTDWRIWQYTPAVQRCDRAPSTRASGVGTTDISPTATGRASLKPTSPRAQSDGFHCAGDTVASVPYRFCELSPTTADLRLFWRDGTGRRIGTIAALSALEAARGERLLFAMNAGMYGTDSQSTPVGLYVQDGHELAPLNTREGCCNFYHKPNGVFIVAGGKAAVMETTEYQRSGVRPDIATQSGPLLVHDGRFPHTDYTPTAPSVGPRNAVGVRPNGKVLFVIADGGTNMHAFRSALRDHFGLQDALYLDGAVSQFYVAPGDPSAEGAFGAMLAIVSRSP